MTPILGVVCPTSRDHKRFITFTLNASLELLVDNTGTAIERLGTADGGDLDRDSGNWRCAECGEHPRLLDEPEDDPQPPMALDGVPFCPATGEHGSICGARRWKVDNDVVTRAAIFVGEAEEVVVDRCAGEARLDRDVEEPDIPGNITCGRCGYELDPEGERARYDMIVAETERMVALSTAPWRVITDYRQF